MAGMLLTLGLLVLLLGATYLIQLSLTLAYWALKAAMRLGDLIRTAARVRRFEEPSPAGSIAPRS